MDKPQMALDALIFFGHLKTEATRMLRESLVIHFHDSTLEAFAVKASDLLQSFGLENCRHPSPQCANSSQGATDLIEFFFARLFPDRRFQFKPQVKEPLALRSANAGEAWFASDARIDSHDLS